MTAVASLFPAGTPLTGSVADAATELLAEDGQPAYLYDLGHLDTYLTDVREQLRAAGGPRLQVLHAIKANPDPGLLGVVARHVDGLEVASGGELAHVRKHLGDVSLAFGGPGKTEAELAAALAGRVDRYHVESLFELRRLDRAARRAGVVARVLLRVNVPTKDTGGAALRMGGVPSPFGMDPAEADTCAVLLPDLPGIEFVGVHAHLASGLDAEACAEQGSSILAWAHEFARRNRLHLREVNVGGGMAVDYHRPGRHFDWAGYAKRLLAAAPDGPVVRIEPGRALTAYSGWYATKVLDVRHSRGEWFAVCTGGTHHLRTPAAKGHSQPLAVLPVDAWNEPWQRPVSSGPVTFVGQLCTPKDVLAHGILAGPVRVGDIVVFAMAGAYAHNISHREFLMHPEPRIVHLRT